VFSVLANRLRWFGGSRPNIRAFRARKRLVAPTGCHIRTSSEAWDATWMTGAELINDAYRGPLPTSARDEAFAQWAAERMGRPADASSGLGVELRFSGPINLGDVSTGRIKSVIDCLYPILGGAAGAPQDSRVMVLDASRMHPEVDGAVRVKVVELAG
jgi:hypothetical protein